MSAHLLPGVLVGHAQVEGRPSGATVVLLPEGSATGVAVRGAAPGTRETDLLDPVNMVEHADAILIAGGSAFGLDAASGVMGWLEEQGRGIDTGVARVPIVPAAVIFDLDVGDPRIRPDARTGRSACLAAVPLEQAGEGSVGAGAGASVGKLLGPLLAMRGGVGVAFAGARGLTVAAVVVVNAVGDVVDPTTGRPVAGARRSPDSLELADTTATVLAHPDSLMLPGAPAPGQAGPAASQPWTPDLAPGRSTTIGVVVTDAALTKTQATRLAQVAHDGLARTIRPSHTALDGDTIFAAGTGTAASGPLTPPLQVILETLAAEVTATAVLRAVRAATSLVVGGARLPAVGDVTLPSR